jgi:hypothetical protein
MTVWYSAGNRGRAAKAVLAMGLLAALLVAAVPAAFFVGLILMLLGHVIGGLALFGASVLAAGAAIVIAGLSGVRHLRKLVSQQRHRVVQLRQGDYRFD